MPIKKDNRPKALRVAETKALRAQKYTYKEIAHTLNMSEATVRKYLLMTDDDIANISSVVKRVNTLHDFELSTLAHAHIKEKIDQARFYELTGLYKISRELQQPRFSQGTQIQNNILIERDKKTNGIVIGEESKQTEG